MFENHVVALPDLSAWTRLGASLSHRKYSLPATQATYLKLASVHPAAVLRRLVDLGWEVIYLASPDVHEGVTAAGGTFSDVNELGKEFGIDAALSSCRMCRLQATRWDFSAGGQADVKGPKTHHQVRVRAWSCRRIYQPWNLQEPS